MRLSQTLGLAIAIATSALPAAAQQPTNPLTVSPQAALNHIGETVLVCGKVVSANFIDGKALLVALDFPYPGQQFSLLIRPVDRVKFGSPEISLLQKRLCSAGTIQLAQGRAQMILSDPKQLAFQ